MCIDDAQPWWLFLCSCLGFFAMPKVYTKPPFTFEQQLARLSKRGLAINDRAYALSKLKTVNYFRLLAYCYPFRIRDKHSNVTSNFVPGANFSEVIQLYEFDRYLRLAVMDAIERVEVYIRTLMTDHLGHTYGTFGHTESSNFHPKFDHARWLEKIEEEADRSTDVFIAHYRRTYSDFPVLPIWMAAEVMSFRSLSIGYKGLKNDDKRAISGQLGLHHNKLRDWLHQLTYIRNLCAHHGRLWNRKLSIRSATPRGQAGNQPTPPRNDRIFYVLLMLRCLLKNTGNRDQWCKQCADLIEPIAREKRWRLAMWLPKDWKKRLTRK